MSDPSKITAINELEAKLAEYIGVKYVIATSLGRTALFVLVKAIELNKEDEVIMPAYICEVVPNAVLKSGGVPIFVDCNKDNYHISLAHLKSLLSPRTRAIIINHIFGYPENIPGIKEAIGNRRILLVEDAAHALGAKFENKRIGSLADAAVFSFTKNMANDGGGAIATNSPEIAERARKILANARTASLFTRLQIGLTSRMETKRVHSRLANSFFGWLEFAARRLRFATKDYYQELKIPDQLGISPGEARLALSQIAALDRQNQKRNNQKSNLDDLLKNTSAFNILGSNDKKSKDVCTWYVIRLKNPGRRSEIKRMLSTKHAYLYEYWDPIPLQQTKYNDRQSPADVPNAIQNASSTLAFKMDPDMSEKELHRIGAALLSVHERNQVNQ